MTEVLHGLTSDYSHGRGFSEVIAIANPAVATGFTYTVTGQYWERLVALTFRLITDNNAANRQVTVTAQDATGVAIAVTAAGGTQAASLTRDYSAVWNAGSSNAVAGTVFVFPAPYVFLQPLYAVVVAIANVQAGDQVSNIRLYREKFDTGPEGPPTGMVTETPRQSGQERLGD